MVVCYGDEFEQYLADLLRGESSVERRRLFEEFVRGSSFFCSRCGNEFETKGHSVEENDEVLCPRCRKKS